LKNIPQYLLHIPNSDWLWTGFALLFITGLLVFFEFATRKWGWNRTVSRKAVHLIVGLLICTTPLIFISNVPLIILSALFITVDWWAIRTRHLTGIHPDEKSYGTVFYPVSILILAILLWPAYKIIFVLATLVMVIADAMAALIGTNFGSKFYIIYEEQKSIPGSLTMYATSGILLFTGIQFFLSNRLLENILLAILVGMVATAAELVSKKGSDNLSVPLLVALFLYGFLGPASETIRVQLITGIVLAALVAGLSYRFRFLKLSGAVVTFLLGSIIFGFGGIKYTVPILVFFIFSSLLSKIGSRKKKEFESSFEKSGVRDMYQVLANGGVAGILVMLIFFLHGITWYPQYLVAVAVATADTWATELGVFSRSRPYLITNFKQVSVGSSGAISILGSLAAMAGSIIILLAGLYFLNKEGQLTLPIVCTVIGGGVLGCFIDSLVGATIQAQYQCRICQKNTEKKIHCHQATTLIKGNVLITNDWVNFLSIATGTLVNFVIIGNL
jgi:uncharacterized protein (TIGR00297 family)